MRSRPVLRRTYSIAGRVLAISTLDEWSAQAVANLVDGWLLSPIVEVNHAPHATLKVSADVQLPQIPSGLTRFDISDGGICATDQSTSFLHFPGALVRIDSSTEVIVWIERTRDISYTTLAQVLSQAFSAALRRCGLFEFHSGAVVPPGQSEAILIAGASGSGKSTLTSQLAAAGWAYLSDDTLMLTERSGIINALAFRRFFALTAAAAASLPSPRPVISHKAKQRFSPSEIFSTHQIEGAKPRSIVFPTISGDSDTRLTQLSSLETMSRLLKFCPWSCYDKVSANDHLKVLSTLARQTHGFALLAGTDLLEDPRLAVNFFQQAYPRN